MGKEIGRVSKIIDSKLSNPTPKKHVLSSSATHISYASNSTRTSISSQLDNKYINTDQINNNTSNTDDIHSCVTPQKNSYSVHATSTTTNYKPFNSTLPIVPI